MPPRQGRSLSLPTLPFQKTNRYAVVSKTVISYMHTTMSCLLSQNCAIATTHNHFPRHFRSSPNNHPTRASCPNTVALPLQADAIKRNHHDLAKLCPHIYIAFQTRLKGLYQSLIDKTKSSS